MIFLRVLPKILLWPHYSGPQELGGPGSLNRMNPVPTPLRPGRGQMLEAVAEVEANLSRSSQNFGLQANLASRS